MLATLTLSACGAAPVAAPAGSQPSAPASASPAAPTSAKPAGSAPGASSANPSAAAANPKKIEIANSSLSGDSIPLWVAIDAGIFQQHGLEVDSQFIAGAAASMATLISGKVQVGWLGGPAVLSSAAGGADIVVLGTASPVIPYKFYVPADIKTAADLKGKKVDLGTTGSAVDVATKIGVQKLGLDPNKDIVYVTTGSHPAATTALMNGAIQGRMDNPPGSVELDAKGFHVLLDMAAEKVPAANSTIDMTRSYLSQNHDVAQAFIDSIVLATARARADKPFTVNVLKKYYKSDDTDAMNLAYDFWMGEVIPSLPYPKVEQFADAKAEQAKTTPSVANLDVPKLLDPSFVQSAADRALDKRS
ncbi:MAG TPA: ABC transporter substrate-binding protein [Caulobacteraceae bacterium]|nr:ABC transporter substrate-binding protein [Caulobacteraceae bacterium]